MNEEQQRRASKFLSLILRHDPSAAGVTIDEHGWVNIAELLDGMRAAGTALTNDELERIVNADSKGRYSIAEDRIRANQGHSIAVDLGLQARTPPALLFHGTALRFLEAIQEGGLLPGERQHVHLSIDSETAIAVGRRHGKPVVLTIDASRMHADGHSFFLSDNGVWLTAHVPAHYLFIDSEPQRN